VGVRSVAGQSVSQGVGGESESLPRPSLCDPVEQSRGLAVGRKCPPSKILGLDELPSRVTAISLIYRIGRAGG